MTVIMKHALLTAAFVLFAMQTEAATRPVVVELFTSQGCSSCPPADAFLGKLAKRPDVIALGYHVDYWDRLGWKDPLSAPGSTERQRAYARTLGVAEIYTPQMVVDGKRDVVGSDRGAILAAIDGGAAPESRAPVTFAADRKSVEIGAGDGRGRVLLVRYALERATPVHAGENAGRTAIDVNGVTAIRPLGDWSGAAIHFDIDPPAAGEGVAILVQSDDGGMLGAGATATP